MYLLFALLCLFQVQHLILLSCHFNHLLTTHAKNILRTKRFTTFYQKQPDFAEKR